MKSTLCCLAAFLTGALLLEIESIYAGLAGLVVLPLIMAWPMWLVINWLIPPLKLEDE